MKKWAFSKMLLLLFIFTQIKEMEKNEREIKMQDRFKFNIKQKLKELSE